MARRKIRKHRVYLTPEEAEEALDLLISGKNVKYVADWFGVSAAGIYALSRRRLEKVFRRKGGNGPCLDKDT